MGCSGHVSGTTRYHPYRQATDQGKQWGGRSHLNPRHPRPQPGAQRYEEAVQERLRRSASPDHRETPRLTACAGCCSLPLRSRIRTRLRRCPASGPSCQTSGATATHRVRISRCASADLGPLPYQSGAQGYEEAVHERLRRSVTSYRCRRPHLDAPDRSCPLPFRSQNRTSKWRSR